MTDTNLIEIFCILDEFCKYFALKQKKHTLESSGKRRRNRPCLMSDSEMMTLLIHFHTSRHRDLKSFYLGYVCHHMRRSFPTACPIIALSRGSRRSDFTFCCSCRPVHWANVQVYPSSTSLRLYPVTLSGPAAIGQ